MKAYGVAGEVDMDAKKRESQVTVEINKQDRYIDELLTAITVLKESLAPVLIADGSNIKGHEENKGPEAQLVPLASRIRLLNLTITTCIKEVRSVIERLEL